MFNNSIYKYLKVLSQHKRFPNGMKLKDILFSFSFEIDFLLKNKLVTLVNDKTICSITYKGLWMIMLYEHDLIKNKLFI